MPNKEILRLETKIQEQEKLIANFQKEQSASITLFKNQEKAIKNLNSDIKILTDGHERLTNQTEQLRNEAKATKKQIKDLKQENKSLENDLAREQQTNLKTTQANQNFSKELSSANKTIKDLTRQNTSLIEKYTQLENSAKNLNNSLSNTQKELLSWQGKVEILEQKLLEAKKQLQEANFSSPIVQSEENSTLADDYLKKIEELEEEKEEILSKAEKARNEQAETIADLETENNQLDTDLNSAIDELENRDKTIANLQSKNQELNKTIADLKTQAKTKEPTKEKPIKTFLCSNCQQTKPQQELSRQFGNFSFCLECSKKARQVATKQKQSPQSIDFLCHLCQQPKTEIPTKMKLDSTLQDYSICSQCKPLAKEFNEAELITDDLWEKYPYSSASEILELEFGIVRK